MGFDAEIVRWIQEFATGTFRPIWIFLARPLIYFYPAFLFLARLSRAMAVAVYEAAWTALVALALSSVLAALVGRVRPYLALQDVTALVPPNIQSGSFPSSHTAVAFGIAAALLSAHLPSGVVALIMAILIAVSRVAVGMHYPSDVIGGAVVGVVAFFLVKAVMTQLGKV